MGNTRELTKTQRAATAYHEAGHVVVAWHLFVKVEDISIFPDEDTAGRVQHANLILRSGKYPELDDPVRARLRMEKGVMITLGGMTAQRQFKPRSVRSFHGSSDYGVAADIALHLHAGDEERANAFLRYVEIETRQVISFRWPWVEVLASALLVQNTIKGTAVAQLLDTCVRPR
jgi:hypothetical protein